MHVQLSITVIDLKVTNLKRNPTLVFLSSQALFSFRNTNMPECANSQTDS